MSGGSVQVEKIFKHSLEQLVTVDIFTSYDREIKDLPVASGIREVVALGRGTVLVLCGLL